MINRCQGCGAKLTEGAKLCPNCGKIVPRSQGANQQTKKTPPTYREPAAKRVYEHKPANVQSQRAARVSDTRSAKTRASSANEQKRTTQQGNKTKRPEERNSQERNGTSAKSSQQRVQTAGKKPRSQPQKASKPSKKKSPVGKIVVIILCIIVVLVVLYLAASYMKIKGVKSETYTFDTPDALLNQDNFGEAAEVFFDEPDWSYNLFSNTVTCRGENKGSTYVITFGAGEGNEIVESINQNDNVYSQRSDIDTMLLRMFM